MPFDRPSTTVPPEPAPATEPDPLAGLSLAEREVVLGLRRTNFARGRSEHTLVVRWNGARVIVLDMRQI